MRRLWLCAGLLASACALANTETPVEAGKEASPSFSLGSFFNKVTSTINGVLKPKGQEKTLLSEIKPGKYEPSSLALGMEKDLAQKRGQGYAMVASEDIQAYLMGIRQKLVGASGVGEIPGTVAVRATSNLEASATPDGNIYLGLSWLLYAENEDEIAAVLAHELAHILLSHFNADILTQVQDRANWIGEMGVTFKLAAEKKQVIGQSDQKMLQQLQMLKTVSELIVLPAWGRSQEREADLLGMDLLAKAGYAPMAMMSMLEKLEEWDRQHAQSDQEFQKQLLEQLTQDAGGAALTLVNKVFGSSHPPADERVRDAAEYMQRFYDGNDQMVDTESWRRIAKKPRIGDVLVSYDKAFSAEVALAKGDPGKALQLAQQSVRGDAGRHAYPNWILAKAASATGRIPLAQQSYAKALQAGDPPKGLYEDVIDFEERSGRLDRALSIAEKAQVEYGDSPVWYPVRIRLLKKSNKRDEASMMALKCSADAPGFRRHCQMANN